MTTLRDTLPFDTSGCDAERQTLGVLGATLTYHPEFGLRTALQASSVPPTAAAVLDATVAASADMECYASCYSGTQFGVRAGQLGDGRCVTVSEACESGAWTAVQLKGALVRTPYRRRLDGALSLGAAVREYVVLRCHARLEIPAAQGIGVLSSPRTVSRAGALNLRAGVLIRSVTSCLRVGTVEALFYTGKHGLLKDLVAHALRSYFPEIASDVPCPACALLGAVVRLSARLVAEWRAVGFVHGALNTDNISLHGEGLDLATGVFLDSWDDEAAPHPEDDRRMFAFGRQTAAMAGAMRRLAEALTPCYIAGPAAVVSLLSGFEATVDGYFSAAVCRRLGMPARPAAEALTIAAAAEALLRAEARAPLPSAEKPCGAFATLYAAAAEGPDMVRTVFRGCRRESVAFGVALATVRSGAPTLSAVPSPPFIPAGALLDRIEALGDRGDVPPALEAAVEGPLGSDAAAAVLQRCNANE